MTVATTLQLVLTTTDPDARVLSVRGRCGLCADKAEFFIVAGELTVDPWWAAHRDPELVSAVVLVHGVRRVHPIQFTHHQEASP